MLIRCLKKYKKPTNGNKTILVERVYNILVEKNLITPVTNNLQLLAEAAVALNNAEQIQIEYDIANDRERDDIQEI